MGDQREGGRDVRRPAVRRALVALAGAAALVLASAWAASPSSVRAATSSGCTTPLSAGGCAWQNTTMVLVHGWELSSAADCSGYWANFVSAETALANASAGHAPRFVKLGYYRGDSNCDANLGSFAGGASIDNNTSIADLGLYLRRYLDATFPGQEVNVVTHSMGGLIVREALSASLDGQAARPLVNHVVTLSGPHEGIYPLLCVGALVSQEVGQMCPGSSFLQSLGTQKNQSRAGTAWALLGSDDDQVVPASSATTSSTGAAGFFPPDLRLAYAAGTGYNHTTMAQGIAADAACEANAADCVNGRYDTGSGFVQVTNHTLPTVFLATSRALNGRPPL